MSNVYQMLRALPQSTFKTFKPLSTATPPMLFLQCAKAGWIGTTWRNWIRDTTLKGWRSRLQKLNWAWATKKSHSIRIVGRFRCPTQDQRHSNFEPFTTDHPQAPVRQRRGVLGQNIFIFTACYVLALMCTLSPKGEVCADLSLVSFMLMSFS